MVPGLFSDSGFKLIVLLTLSLETFSDILSKYELIPFFPALSSGEETGFKRGCVIIARNGNFSKTLDNLKSLCRKNYA